MSVILPKITSAKFVGFRPIFNDTVHITVKHDFFVILGGNGLGKTTLLQALVYGLAGEYDIKIENDSKPTLNKNYFKQRFEDVSSAFVEIGFFLGRDEFLIKRGFGSANILSISVNNEPIADTPKNAEEAFSIYLNNAGYSSMEEFKLIVHKLCYLSEYRENLAWDINSQIRLLMIIFKDIVSDKSFVNRRAQLKQLDSKKRHLNVDVNNAKRELQNALAEKANRQVSQKEDKNTSITSQVQPSEELTKKIIEVSSQIQQLRDTVYQDKKLLHEVAEKIEIMQSSISVAEEAFVLETLKSIESEDAKLALHKLIFRAQCPACGSKTKELSEKAKKYIVEHSCPLCGVQDIASEIKLNPALDAEYSELLTRRLNLESSIIDRERKVFDLEYQENRYRYELNQILLEIPRITINYAKVEKKDPEELQKYLTDLEKKFRTLEFEFSKLKTELDQDYALFLKQSNHYFEKLADVYANYATEFLGVQCTLVPINPEEKFLNLRLYVPKFNDKIRDTPESCSEAQRFFLDIAFRMALIDFTGKTLGYSGTFLCETPENALDITYINNVSEMFRLFVKEHHGQKNSLILTSNLQREGITQSLLHHVPVKTRQEYILNLVKIGDLSKVQMDQMDLLDEVLNEILTNETPRK